jgi:hypothetical protein
MCRSFANISLLTELSESVVVRTIDFSPLSGLRENRPSTLCYGKGRNSFTLPPLQPFQPHLAFR